MLTIFCRALRRKPRYYSFEARGIETAIKVDSSSIRLHSQPFTCQVDIESRGTWSVPAKHFAQQTLGRRRRSCRQGCVLCGAAGHARSRHRHGPPRNTRTKAASSMPAHASVCPATCFAFFIRMPLPPFYGQAPPWLSSDATDSSFMDHAHAHARAHTRTHARTCARVRSIFTNMRRNTH
jgi:hypothetical protein